MTEPEHSLASVHRDPEFRKLLEQIANESESVCEVLNSNFEMTELMTVDFHKLDEGWSALPEEVHFWNRKQVMFETFNRNLKSYLETERSIYDSDIREFPSNYGVSKVTEGSVTAAVNSHPDVIKINKIIQKVDHRLRMIKALCLGLDTKRQSFEGLTKLFSAGWFANKPLSPSSSTETVQIKQHKKLNEGTSKERIQTAKTKTKKE